MSYSNGLLSDQSYQTANKYVQRGLPGIDFKLTDTGDYDMQNKKLVNVDEGENNQDVVNKHQLDVGLQTKPNKTDVLLLDGTSHMVGDLDLRGNKIILPGEIQMDRKLITNLDTDENQDLSAVNMITLKNKVKPKADKDYVDFENTKQNVLINNAFIKKIGDQMTGDLILLHDSYPVQGNTNKAISYETQREIFLSRRESFPMQADINMNNKFIQNIATPTSSHQVTNKGYCDYNFLNRQSGGVLMGPLSMNRNDLFEIPAPKYGNSAVNKNYVDGEITKIDTTQFVKKVGDTMTGNLDMSDHLIQKVGDPVNSDDVATKNYVDAEIGYTLTPFMKLDGTRAMTGVLNMNDHKISNLKMPEFNNDAVNKQYIDEKLMKSHLISTEIENSFKYLSDQDESSSERNITVNGIVDFNGSPHKNKKAYDIDLIYTSGTQNYDSKIGINLYLLPVGKFTIIMEYYFPEDKNISLLAEASTAIIIKQTITHFPSYKKQLVQINQQTKDTPDYLFFTIRGLGTTTTNPEGYLVFYGVKEWVDTVPSEIYDHVLETGMFEYDNGNMKINNVIDMDNHKIKNLSNGTDANDAVNKQQFDAEHNDIKNQINILSNKYNTLFLLTKNYTYKKIFPDNFYDFNDSSKFNLQTDANGLFIDRVFPNFYTRSTINFFQPPKGFNLSNGSYIRTPSMNLPHIITSVNISYTFFISFLHDERHQYSMHFISDDGTLAYPPTITIDGGLMTINMRTFIRSLHFPSKYKNKQMFIWFCFEQTSRIYTMVISDFSSQLTATIPGNIRFNMHATKLTINYDGFIKKIGFITDYISIGSTEFNEILLQEKINGTYLAH